MVIMKPGTRGPNSMKGITGLESWVVGSETYGHDGMNLEGYRESLGTWQSNPSIPKEINPEYSLGGLTLELKL